MKTLKTTLLLLTLATLCQSQELEIDLSSNALLTRINFHHDAPVDTDDDESYDNTGSLYSIGLTNSIGKNWYLRTELGYTVNNSFFAANYSFDEGLGNQNALVITHLNNQKMHLGLFPEYRKSIYNITYGFGGGLFYARDISNTMSTRNEILLPKSRMLGFKLNSSLIIGQKKIRVRLNVGHTWLGRGQLFNRYHPKISYRSFNFGMGLIYVMDYDSSHEHKVPKEVQRI